MDTKPAKTACCGQLTAVIDKMKGLFDNRRMSKKKHLQQRKKSVPKATGAAPASNLQPADEDKVRLKPLFGIRPGVYLAFIYGVIILALLFFLFLGPGIWRPGSVLVFSSEPFGAACRIDGVYWAAAPAEVFVPPGKHRVEMVLPGFGPWSTEIEVPNRLFASLFFPLKTPVHGELKSSGPISALNEAAAEFAAWTFAGEPSGSTQVPLSLSEAAYRLGPEAADPFVREAMEGILDSSLRFGVTRAGLRDLLRAKFLIDSRGISPSPLNLLDSAGEILELLADTPGVSLWLSDLLQGEAASRIAASSWYEEELRAAAAIEASSADGPAQPVDSILLEGVRFWQITGGSAVQGSLFPRELQFETFYVAEAEISRALWDNFLEARPEWKAENTEALMKNGLVSEDYLLNIRISGAPPSDDGNSPVTSLSWYAASAFCEWFNTLLPPRYSGWEIRLPYEAEWEYAAGALPEMVRNHWEWCMDDFAPLDFFPLNEKYNPGSPERSVRGGSWFNPVNSINAGTRASLPPDTCSVFVSFRPVLVPMD